MINEHPAMQLQNIFYYVRFVNRILDDILCMRIDSIRLVIVSAVWFAGRQFSMFHRVIIISFYTYTFAILYVMVDSCFYQIFPIKHTTIIAYMCELRTERFICTLHGYQRFGRK